MKLAASSRPESCASLKNTPGTMPVHRSLLALVKTKQNVVRDQLSPQIPVRAIDSSAQWLITSLARRRSDCPPPSLDLVLTHPIERTTLCLRVLRLPTWPSTTTVSPASCVPPLPEGHKIGARKEAHWMNTIIHQSNRRRRVSTDGLNHFNSQLVECLEVGSSPISTGKTIPHLYPKTGFLREWERTHNVVCGSLRYIIVLTLWD